MHRSALTGTKRRTRRARRCGPRGTLKNRLSRHRASGRRPRNGARCRCSRRGRGCFVDGTGAGLRHDHPWRRRHGRRWSCGRCKLHFCQVRGSLGRRRSAPYRRCWTRGADSRGNGDRRRCCACGRCRANRRRRSRWNLGWNHDDRRRAVGGRHRCGSNDSRSRRRGRRSGRFNRGLRRNCLRQRW